MKPNQDSALGFIFNLIWPTDAHTHTLVQRLAELRATKDDFLTEEEYAQIRSTFLEELTTRPRMSFVQVVILLTFCLGGVAGIIYCLLGHVPGIVWVPALPLAASALIWRRLEKELAAKRNLSRADRLRAVDELATADLISAEDAPGLRAGIEKLYENQRLA